MKILYISHLHPPEDHPLESIGGMQNVSMQMLDVLKKKEGIEVEEIILRTSWSNIGLKTFMFLVSLLKKIPEKVDSFKPDVILFSSMVTAGVLPFMIKKPDVPCVTINHGQDVTLPINIYQWYLPKVFQQLQGVISVSAATREACIERGMDPEIGVALPNGFEPKNSADYPDKKIGRKLVEKQFGVNLEGKSLLLTVGRQVKRKGHQWFIDEVMDKISSDVLFLIVGDGPESGLIEIARENNPKKDNIIIAGRLSDDMLQACYAAADLFVMPNIPVEGDMEGFGIVLLEANSAGVPAVASNLEGIKDVIQQGVNGYRVRSRSPKLFSKKIDEVLQGDLEELSESSKKYVLEHFGWDSVVNRYIQFLNKVITKT